MGVSSRRQSARLAEKAVVETQERDASGVSSGVQSGRVGKTVRASAGRTVASRYMGGGTGGRRAEAGGQTVGHAGPRVRAAIAALHAAPPTVAAAAKPAPAKPAPAKPVSVPAPPTATVVRRETRPLRGPAPQPAAAPAAAVHGAQPVSAVDLDDGAYGEYLQWLLLEARGQMCFDEAKAAAALELERLAQEMTEERRMLAEERRKLKLMRELAALSRWMTGNRAHLESMRRQVDGVGAEYLRLGRQLAETTRAMPLKDVQYGDGLVADMDVFAATVAERFAGDSAVAEAMQMAACLGTYYRGAREEARLLSECQRLKESLEHTAALASSMGGGR
ncbi:hypothetical protein GGI07_002659 [Coemansia sp. Benny D115]|nr:hypothetical protein GGI07_002659 [Coemansia sp. Benny D115]